MSYANPTEHQISNPTLLDAEIKNIQIALDTLTWLSKSFGRAYKFTKLVNNRKVTYPAIFQAWKKDYYNAFPNDNLTSYSFIYAEPEEITEYATKKTHLLQRNISIIFFFNLEEIDNTLQYRFTEKLKEDIFIKLSTLKPTSLEITRTSDEIEDVFSDFTVEEIKPEYLNERFGALRFDCTIFYQNTNCTLNTYSP